MKTNKDIEFIGEVLVREVRNARISRMHSHLFDGTKSTEILDVVSRLNVEGMSESQRQSLMSLVSLTADFVLGDLLATIDHKIATQQLSIRVSAKGEVDKHGYNLRSMDALATRYYGEGSWIDRFGIPKIE